MDPHAAYGRYVNPFLGRFLEASGRGYRFVRASGCQLHDSEGNAWDDWVAGFGTFNFGHRHPGLAAAAKAALDGVEPTLLHEAINPHAGALGERLVRACGEGFGTVFLSNSGSEAVEAALKVALAATGRGVVVYADGAFHGTTLGALSCMGQGDYRAPFEAVLAPFVEVPFGEIAPLQARLERGDVAAVILEPMQMEAGGRLASADYLASVRSVCARQGTLLILDEVQTGMGRTGQLTLSAELGVRADALVFAKALGGGLIPVGATVLGEGLWDRAFGSYERSEIHGSTYGGGALACAVAHESLRLATDPELLSQVRGRGQRLFAALTEAIGTSPLVERIDHAGLLGVVRFRQPDHPWLGWQALGLQELEGRASVGALVVERLARRHVFAQICGHDWASLRVQPPLIVDDATCDRFVAALVEAVAWLEDAAS